MLQLARLAGGKHARLLYASVRCHAKKDNPSAHNCLRADVRAAVDVRDVGSGLGIGHSDGRLTSREAMHLYNDSGPICHERNTYQQLHWAAASPGWVYEAPAKKEGICEGTALRCARSADADTDVRLHCSVWPGAAASGICFIRL